MPPRTRAAREAEEKKKQLQNVPQNIARSPQSVNRFEKEGESPQISTRGQVDIKAARAEASGAPPPVKTQGQEVLTGEQRAIQQGIVQAGIQQQIQGQLAQQSVRPEQSEVLERARPEAEQFLATEQLPISPTPLVQPFSTEEGQAQFQEARKRELQSGFIGRAIKALDASDRAVIRETSDDDLLAAQKIAVIKLKNTLARETLKLAGNAILSFKASGETVGDVPVVGDLITGITGDRKEVVTTVKSSLEARNQMSADIARDVLEGRLNPNDGFRAIDAIEMEVDRVEALMQREAVLSPAVRRSGELEDLQTDILELRQEIFRSRDFISQGVVTGDFDPDAAIFRIKELREQRT